MRLDGREIEVLERGSGRTVVLLHSSGLSRRQWRRLVAAGEHRYRFVAPDFAGYGRGDAWRGDRGGLSADLGVVTDLLRRMGPAHLVGHAYGGAVALLQALRTPDRVIGVIAFEPPVFGPVKHAPIAAELARLAELLHQSDEALVQGLVDWWNGLGAYDALRPEVRAQLRTSVGKVRAEVADLLADHTPASAFARLPPSTLLLRGARTPAVVREALRSVASHASGVSIEILTRGAHMAPLTQAEPVNARILAQLDAASAAASVSRPVAR